MLIKYRHPRVKTPTSLSVIRIPCDGSPMHLIDIPLVKFVLEHFGKGEYTGFEEQLGHDRISSTR